MSKLVQTPAPILVSVYNRPRHFKGCLEALASNDLAKDSEVYVISDAPSRAQDVEAVQKVRAVAEAFKGFKRLHLIARNDNWGFFRSIYGAQQEAMASHGKYIFLEDDIEVANGFLEFMNTGLAVFEHDPRVFSISGYCPSPAGKVPASREVEQVLAAPFFCPWGFATWADRFGKVDMARNNYLQIRANRKLRMFMARECPVMIETLRRDYVQNIDAMDVRASCQMLVQGMVSVYPSASLTRNLGFDGTGEHMSADLRMADQPICENLGINSWELQFDPAFELAVVRYGTSIRFSPLFQLLYWMNIRDEFDFMIRLLRRVYQKNRKPSTRSET